MHENTNPPAAGAGGIARDNTQTPKPKFSSPANAHAAYTASLGVTITTEEVTAALDMARGFAQQGVRIIRAYRCLNKDKEWSPTAGEHGYVLPVGWENSQADPVVVDEWRPRMGLFAVVGREVAVLPPTVVREAGTMAYAVAPQRTLAELTDPGGAEPEPVPLCIPVIGPDDSTVDAAFKYADAGWYLAPVRPDDRKNPGGRLGKGWPSKTFRDPESIVSYFAGSSDGLALHNGRSGAISFDVDDPEKLHPLIKKAIAELDPPHQSSRPDQPGRGHYLFALPPGRMPGNSVPKALAGGWGQIRGRNGVIIVAPSLHAEPDGQYEWLRTGSLPLLPGYLLDLLVDTPDAESAATDAEVQQFMEQHTAEERPDLLDVHVRSFHKQVAAGGSRHDTMVGHLLGAMKDAAAGLLDARTAADTLESVFLDAVSRKPKTGSKQGASRTGPRALAEFAGILSWAVAQAIATDPAAHRHRISEMVDKTVAYDTTDSDLLDEADAQEDYLNGPLGGGDRRLVLTRADTIKPRRVRWLWDDRMALETLALMAGREGTGKSTFCYWCVAQVTNGTLPGEYVGQPTAVLICATEDSWEHTIVPRLIAAGADLSRVFRVDVYSADDIAVGLSLPRDLKRLAQAAEETGAVLLLLDPLMSRLDAKLDTHKDAEVRRALEPLVAVAEKARLTVLGIMHHNKSGSADPLQLVMGSKAFTAVARSVHTVIPDPNDETEQRRLFGTPKNNLGRTDLPTLAFTISGFSILTDDGIAWTGKLTWVGETSTSIGQAMRDAADEDRSATDEAGDWLVDYLSLTDGRAYSADVKKDGVKAGHTYDALKRAKGRRHIAHESVGFPRRTVWMLPQSGQQSEHPSTSAAPTAPTAPTAGETLL